MSMHDIREAAISRLQTLLPTYAELHNVFNIEENTERDLEKGFAVLWGIGNTVPGCTRKVSFEHTLTVKLTNAVSVRSMDNVAPEVDDLYNDIDNVVKSFCNHTFLGIPDILKGFRKSGIAPPVLISGNQFVLIELNFQAAYSLDINYT